ncbi:hypothetical protein J437_LFUL013494 [Ladona fulva]|uniref:DUF4795 domain-containing protein n=1 Tax=Ladona fulva TaxID=123851 RepID=A0A8K0KIA8_LADFU|nr:hypothetical protein J437_LFUL013494 [Ladona fulva]
MNSLDKLALIMAVTAAFSNLIEGSFPEIGSVNLIQLRSLLLALINHLQLYDTKVEYDETAIKKGKDESSSKHSMDSLKTVDEDRGGISALDKSVAQNLNLKSRKPSLKRKIVDQVKEEDMNAKDAMIVEELEKKGQITDIEKELGILNEKINTQGPATEGRNVSDIERKLKAMEMWPNNEELISRSRQPTNTPFSDWWNMSNLAKRMDASEESLSKFASALEEMSREVGKTRERMKEKSDETIKDEQHTESKSSLDEMGDKLAEALEKTDRKVAKMKKEISDLTAQQNNILTFTESLRELYNKLQSLQEEIESLNETTTVLISGQKERESNINSLLEQVQLIKNIKADKEGLEDALAEKADAFSVNRKVSHDQFDAAYYELNRSIIDAQARLGCQVF